MAKTQTKKPTKAVTNTPLKMNAAQKAKKDAMQGMITNAYLLRSELLTKLLNPGKDINYECGYPDAIDIQSYKKMFKRNGVAKRVVKILPEETWALPPKIFEKEEAEETEFEKAWKEVKEEKRVFHYLQRIDVLSGIGEFGILLLGIDDGKELQEPVDGINKDTGEKVGTSEHKLLYLKPFDQSVIKVKTREVSVSSPRFGFPVTYDIDFEGTATSDSKQTKVVHWTRVIHIADGREMSEVNGTPRMEPVYNRLLDLRKILGGSGEMFWKGGFPGLSFETQPDVEELDTDSIKEQVDLYMAGMQRFLVTEGIMVKSLTPQVSSPKDHVETNMRNIAISLGVPYRIFLGTEEAKLASSQDVRTWNKRLAQRQENYVSLYIIRPFVDRLIIFGILPEVEQYTIDWPDLNAPTDEDVANVAKILTEAMAKYIVSGVDTLIPPMEFLTKIIGMTQEEAEAIEKAALKYIVDHPPEEEEEAVEVVEVEAVPAKVKKSKKKIQKKKKVVR